MAEVIPLYDRSSGELTQELVYGQAQMDFVYGHPLGRLLENILLSRPWISRAYGLLSERPSLAASRIQEFVKTYQVETDEIKLPLSEFKTFQDFFVRELKPEARPMPEDPNLLISPADGRMSAWPLEQGRLLMVKGRPYTLLELLRNRSLAQQYTGGICLIYRLAPVDYHRYAYIDDGWHGPHVRLGSKLHSVHPLAHATGMPVFTENVREYTLLHTQRFGTVLHMEVGALVVGKIVQRQLKGGTFTRGSEKGWFELGGSTVIQLFEPGRIILDSDIAEYAKQGIETLVRYRMPVGRTTAK